MNRLAGKVAIVTGAGRGIGAAIARAFVREGAAVAIAELDAALAEESADAIARDTAGARVLAVPTDVARPSRSRRRSRARSAHSARSTCS